MIINDVRIHPSVLRKEKIERCRLAECMAACCSGGVWLDAQDVPHILQRADAIKPFLPPDRRDESTWFSEEEPDPDFPSGHCVGTNIVDDPQRPGQTCCVFLRHDRKCGLQVTSEAHNLGWPGLKPYYCAIYPMYVTDDTLMMDDETMLDFEGGGCRRPAPEPHAMYQIYRQEVTLVLGKDGYRELCERVEKQTKDRFA